MKVIAAIFWSSFICTFVVQAQDTAYLKQLHTQVNLTLKTDPPQAIKLSQKEIEIAQKSNYTYGEAVGHLDLGKALWILGDYPRSLKLHHKALELFEKIDSLGGIISAYNDISLIYLEQGDYEKTLQNLFKAQGLNATYRNKKVETIILVNIGETYLKLQKLDSAGIFTQKAYASAIETNDTTSRYAILNNLGSIYLQQEKFPLAIEHYKLALDLAKTVKDNRYTAEILTNLGDYFLKTNQPDSSLSYLYEALRLSKQMTSGKRIIDAAALLQKAYKTKSLIDSAYTYSEMILKTKDSISSAEKIRQVQNLAFLEDLRQEQIAEEKAKEQKEYSDLIQYISIAIALIILFSILLLLRKKAFKFRFVEILATVGLLLLFEFIALIIHPVIARITHHTPYLMLVILTLVASILVPLHHYLITLSKKYLLKKHRKRSGN